MFSGRRGNLPQIATNSMGSRNNFIRKGLLVELLNLGNIFKIQFVFVG